MRRFLAGCVLMLFAALSINGGTVLDAATSDAMRRTSSPPNEDNWSLSYWVKVSAAPAGLGYQFELADSGNLHIARIYLTAAATTLEFGANLPTAGSTSLSLDTWYHIAARRSGTAAFLYLNAVQEISDTFSETAGPITEITYGNRYLGSTLACACTYAAFKFWNAYLSPEELANEQWGYRPRRTATLYHWIPVFKGDATADLYDLSGNGFDMPEVGTIATADGPPIGW